MPNDLETLRSILKNLLNRIDHIEKILNPDREAKITELTSKVEELEDEKETLVDQLSNVETYLDDAENAIENAKNEL